MPAVGVERVDIVAEDHVVAAAADQGIAKAAADQEVGDRAAGQPVDRGVPAGEGVGVGRSADRFSTLVIVSEPVDDPVFCAVTVFRFTVTDDVAAE